MVHSKLQGRMPFAYHTTFLLLFLSITSFGQQNLCLDQVNTFNSQMQGSAFMTVIDSQENIYILGSFQETVTFGDGPGQVVLVSNGGNDSYLVKNDPEGNFIWVKQFGGSESDVIEILAIDNQDELYISGSFVGDMDMDPSVAQDLKNSEGEKDLFLIKLSAQGTYRWSKQMMSTTTSEPKDLEVLPDGSVALVFNFVGQQDANMGFSEEIIDDSDGSTALMKMNSDGVFQWVKQFNVFYPLVTFDEDQNLILCGNFNTTVDFDPGLGINIMSPVSGQSDLFILKLDGDGEFLWSKQVSGNSIKEIYDITCDKENNVLYTGFFVGLTDFDPGPEQHSINSSNGTDAFMSKLDENGTHVFTKDLGVVTPCNGENIATDQDGDIYMSGFFISTMDFNPNAGEFIMENSGFGNHFILKLKANGGFVYAKQLEGDMPINGNDLIVTHDKKVIISGGYNGTVDFDLNEGTFEHTTPSGNSYVAIYFQEERVSISELLCESFLSPSGDLVWTEPGQYNDTIASPDGCLTVYDIDLYEINTTMLMTDAGDAMYAWQDGASYQWVDCNNNYEDIEGATERFFSPTEYGHYAVEISMGGCSAISNCVEFTFGEIVNSVNEIDGIGFDLFPNPANEHVNITAHNGENIRSVALYDAFGRKVFFEDTFNSNNISLKMAYSPGIYILEVNENFKQRKKLVKHL